MPTKTEKEARWTRLWKRQKGKCYYCKEPMQRVYGHADSATLDHYIPKSKAEPGNNEDLDNLVLACFSCNQIKADRIPDGVASPVRQGPWEVVPGQGKKWVGHEA